MRHCTFAVWAFTASSLLAQTQFAELGAKSHLPLHLHYGSALAIGDVNGDGHDDLVVTAPRLPSPGTFVYLNDGTARFRDAMPTPLPGAVAMALGDVDGDGDRDLVLAEPQALLLNDGSGSFVVATAGNLPTSRWFADAIVLADVDGDGDRDLLVATGSVPGGQRNRLLLNDGAGHFVDITVTHLPAEYTYTQDLAVGDVDGDGDLDFVAANDFDSPTSRNGLYLNDGSGHFSAAPSALPPDDDSSNGVALGDVDGDGDLDLFVANFHDPDRLYLNDGTGRFVDVTAQQLPLDLASSRRVVFADVDGDGDLDAAVADATDVAVLYVNDGAGTFTMSPLEGSSLHGGYAIGAADLDGDGAPEIAVGTSDALPTALFLNDGSGGFDPGVSWRLPGSAAFTSAFGTGDVDGDGRTDLVLGQYLLGPGAPGELLWLQRDNGAFIDATQALPGDSVDSQSIDLGDVDGDGDLDLLIGKSGESNRLFRNDGHGSFSFGLLATRTDPTRQALLVDIDGDGDLDAVVANAGTPNRLYRNGGQGTFVDVTAGQLPGGSDDTRCVVAADVDGDGDADLAFGNAGQGSGEQNRLLLNDGSGVYSDVTATHLPADVDATSAATAADLDGDGDADLVFGNTQGDRLYRNDGTGTFVDATATAFPPSIGGSLGVAAADVDADGDLDLMRAALVVQPPGDGRLLLNDGTGRFTDVSAARLPTTGSLLVVGARDLDGDGDPEILFGEAGPLQVLWNLHRQLDAPYVARLGLPFTLVFHARPGYASVPGIALPLLAGARLPMPVAVPPYGSFWLDPQTSAPLPWIGISPVTSTGTWETTIPSNVNLVGLSFYGQALLIDLAATQPPAHLSSVTSDPVFAHGGSSQR